MTDMHHELTLPEGFVFEGDMQFVEAKVIIDRGELARTFKNLCLVHIDNWEDGDYEHTDQNLPVKINGELFKGTIVNMNQTGELIIELSGYNNPSVAPALGIKESSGQFFYVRTRRPALTGDPVVAEQGVMVHDSYPSTDDPIHGNHADAIVAFSYLKPVL